MKEDWFLSMILESGNALTCPYWIRALSLGRRMRTYAVVSFHPAGPAGKITPIDNRGGSNPNWNCKFACRLIKDMLFNNRAQDKYRAQGMSIVIDIYCAALGLMIKDKLIGTAILKLKDIPINRYGRFRGLEVWRVSGSTEKLAGRINVKTNLFFEKVECKKTNCVEAMKKVARNCANCTICLEGWGVLEEQRMLVKCGHIFHKDCLDLWWKEVFQNYCPNCCTVVHQSDIVPL